MYISGKKGVTDRLMSSSLRLGSELGWARTPTLDGCGVRSS